jgi:hypothetical protein
MNRKIIILLSALIVSLLPTHSDAQSEGGRSADFWGGIVLGGGFFKFSGEGIESAQSSGAHRPGIIAGGLLAYDLHQRIMLDAEVLIGMKGSYHLVDGERFYSYSLYYLELPLLARLSLPSIKDTLIPFLAAGPVVSVLLGAKGEDVRQDVPVDLEGAYKSTDFGVIFGAGAAMRISSYDLLGLEFRYDMGLRAVVNNRDTINNRGLLLVLRYQTCLCSRNGAR